jgi:hypothetical protein
MAVPERLRCASAAGGRRGKFRESPGKPSVRACPCLALRNIDSLPALFTNHRLQKETASVGNRDRLKSVPVEN